MDNAYSAQYCPNHGIQDIPESVNSSLSNFSSSMKIAIPIVIGILLLLGLLGNTLVIWVTFTSERVIKHPLHSMLVVNLAVADLVYLIASGPYQAVTNSVPGWVFGSILCRFLHFFNILTMGVSIFTMCSLAFLRFVGLIIPFRFENSCLTTSKKLAGTVIIMIAWVTSSILALPNLFYFNYLASKDFVFASCEWQDLEADARYSVTLLVITYVIPLILVSVLYFVISRKIFRGVLSHDERDRSESFRTTLMVCSLILAFLVCWLPHHLYRIILASRRFCSPAYALMRAVLEVIGYCFSYAHACANPAIYTFAAPNFRRNLRISLRRNNRRRKSPQNGKTRDKLQSNDEATLNAVCSKVTTPVVIT